MPVLSKREDYAARLQTLVGDRNDDETLSIIQDLTETYDSFSANASGLSQADVDAAVAQRDNEWRERYKKAFFSGKPEPLGDNKTPPQTNPKPDPATPDPNDPSSYDELFKS